VWGLCRLRVGFGVVRKEVEVAEAACGVYAASAWVSRSFEGRGRWRVGSTSPPCGFRRHSRGGGGGRGGMWGAHRLRVVFGVVRRVGKAACGVHAASVSLSALFARQRRCRRRRVGYTPPPCHCRRCSRGGEGAGGGGETPPRVVSDVAGDKGGGEVYSPWGFDVLPASKEERMRRCRPPRSWAAPASSVVRFLGVLRRLRRSSGGDLMTWRARSSSPNRPHPSMRGGAR